MNRSPDTGSYSGSSVSVLPSAEVLIEVTTSSVVPNWPSPPVLTTNTRRALSSETNSVLLLASKPRPVGSREKLPAELGPHQVPVPITDPVRLDRQKLTLCQPAPVSSSTSESVTASSSAAGSQTMPAGSGAAGFHADVRIVCFSVATSIGAASAATACSDTSVTLPRVLAFPVSAMNRLSARSEEHTSELQSRPHLVC